MLKMYRMNSFSIGQVNKSFILDDCRPVPALRLVFERIHRNHCSQFLFVTPETASDAVRVLLMFWDWNDRDFIIKGDHRSSTFRRAIAGERTPKVTIAKFLAVFIRVVVLEWLQQWYHLSHLNGTGSTFLLSPLDDS